MTAVLVDTHAHLEDARFDPDREAVLERAALAGVRTVLTCGSDLASSRQAVELARQFGPAAAGRARVVAAVGIHPHEAAQVEDVPQALAALREMARQPGVVAIGEIGLDYHYDFAPRPRQRELFLRQLELAGQLGLPVVVHTREAVDDVLELMQAAGICRGVLHAFAGTPQQARWAIELGLYLGAGGMLTFRNAQSLRSTLQQVPLERLLLETDAPYLAPVPYRGRRNEPAYVAEVARQLAELLGLPVEELARLTTANARRLFGPDL